MKRVALSFVLFAGLALCAQPWAWPARHTHVEVETAYSSQDLHQVKQWYYDFTDLKLRVDAKPFESAVAGTYFGLQSFWLNNTLTMITSVAGLSFCVQLDMPFGMMTPDWFLGPDAVVLTPLTNTRAYRPKYEQVYTVTGWHRMNAGVGYFDYFFDNSTGSPYRMSAPGPSPSGSGSFANIQNEYYDFSIVPSFPQGTFAWPSNVNCTVGAGMKFVPETFAEILAAVPQPRGLPAEHHNYLARHLHHLLSYPRRV